MAKYERTFSGDFDSALARLHKEIMSGSMSASLEDSTYYSVGDVRCALRVYERYSVIGNNRLSCSVMMTGKGNTLKVTAITSGGSQAVFFKINTFGEDAFLDKVRAAVDSL